MLEKCKCGGVFLTATEYGETSIGVEGKIAEGAVGGIFKPDGGRIGEERAIAGIDVLAGDNSEIVVAGANVGV